VKGKLLEIQAKADALSERERIIITVAIAVFVWIVFQLVVFDVFAAEKKKAVSKAQGYQQEMIQFEQSSAAVLTAYRNNPNTPIENEIAALNKKLEEVNIKLATAKEELISPSKMAEVLRSILAKNKKLKLLKLESLPTEVTLLNSEEETSKDLNKRNISGSTQAGSRENIKPYQIYMHGLVLELEGSYWEVHQYLEAIENLPWRLYWHSLSYEVKSYPTANIKLRVNTYSTEEGWIGV